MKKNKSIYNSLESYNGIVIAEFACGHEGDIEKFKNLVDGVKHSEAKIIKSQIFVPIERVDKSHHEWQLFNDVCLSEQDWYQAVDYAKKAGKIFFSDIFGEEGLRIAEKAKVDGYKIHSEDLLNTSFIEKVAKIGKPLMIGVGGAHRIEILKLLEHLKKKELCNEIILMPGIQTFPTPLSAHSILEIKELIEKYSKRFKVKVGCADHISGDLTEALDFPLMCLSSGACLIEKHVTSKREYKWEDYQSALDAEVFNKFCSKVKKFSNLLKPLGPLNNDELSYRYAFKKTAIAKKDIRKNKTINKDDIEFIKLEKNKLPLSAIDIVGRKSNQLIKKGNLVTVEKLKNRVGAVIVARLSSSRLPKKALKKIVGQESLSLLINRIKRCKEIDEIILSTSTHKMDKVLKKIALKFKIKFFTGDLNNVSNRFFQTAKKFDLDHIVRITGDDVLRDEIMIDKAIASHLKNSCDVTITTNMPYGTQSEIFTYDCIKSIMENANNINNTEYLEWFLQNDRYFSVNYVKSDYKFNKRLRLTLDYPEDLKLFEKIFSHFKKIKKLNFSLKDVLDFLEKNPNISKINDFLIPKFETKKNASGAFVSDKIDVSLKI